MDNNTLNFAKFVFAFHWIAYALAGLAVALAAVIAEYKSSDIYVTLGALIMAAVLGWSMSRDGDGWRVEDAMWHGFCLAWMDGVAITSVLALLITGHTTPNNFIIGAVVVLAGLPRAFMSLRRT